VGTVSSIGPVAGGDRSTIAIAVTAAIPLAGVSDRGVLKTAIGGRILTLVVGVTCSAVTQRVIAVVFRCAAFPSGAAEPIPTMFRAALVILRARLAIFEPFRDTCSFIAGMSFVAMGCIHAGRITVFGDRSL